MLKKYAKLCENSQTTNIMLYYAEAGAELGNDEDINQICWCSNRNNHAQQEKRK